MNAVGTSITAIRSPAAQIIVVHLLALVIKATLATALSAQVWSDIKLKHCMLMMNSKFIYSKRRASASASITFFYCGVLMFSMAIIQ